MSFCRAEEGSVVVSKTKRNEMITKDKNNVLMFKQILPTSVMRNIWGLVRRTCMLISGLKGLNNC